MQSLTTPLLFVIALAVLGYFVAKARAMQVAGGDIRGLVSLPKQHALNTLLATVIPAIGAVLLISLYSRIAGTTPGWFFSLVVLGLDQVVRLQASSVFVKVLVQTRSTSRIRPAQSAKPKLPSVQTPV